MKKCLIALATIGAFGLASSVATAEPTKLTKAELDKVVAGAITPGSTTQLNGGGNTPSGTANGVPIITTPATNPAGKAPSGQNK